jgi:hypothetical protein
MEKDLVFLVSLNFFVFILFSIFHSIPVMQSICILFLFVKNIRFVKIYGLTPTPSSLGDRFSWKFLQGLPINKKELLISLVLSSVIVFIPFILWIMFFWKQLIEIAIEGRAMEQLPNIYKFIVNMILFMVFVGILNVKNVIVFPRYAHRSGNKKNHLVILLRKSLFLMLFLMYFFIAFAVLDTSDVYITKAFHYGFIFVLSWWFPAALLFFIVYQYHSTLKIWLDEKSSYIPEGWSQKKEWSAIVVCTILLAGPFTLMDFNSPPEIYTGNELLKAVYQKDYTLIQNEIKLHHDINKKNLYGFTPLLVAVHQGDMKLIGFLEKNGANFSGRISKKEHYINGFNALMLAIDSKNSVVTQYVLSQGFLVNEMSAVAGTFPVHVAAAACKSQILDLLIEKGADINSMNAKGETPLIIAAKANCFAGAVALKEAGAQFEVVDKNGKKAMDYFSSKNANREFAYFMEKHSRLPASK